MNSVIKVHWYMCLLVQYTYLYQCVCARVCVRNNLSASLYFNLRVCHSAHLSWHSGCGYLITNVYSVCMNLDHTVCVYIYHTQVNIICDIKLQFCSMSSSEYYRQRIRFTYQCLEAITEVIENAQCIFYARTCIHICVHPAYINWPEAPRLVILPYMLNYAWQCLYTLFLRQLHLYV